jgi:hypothetical protein
MRELTLDKLPSSVLGKLDLETAFIASRVVRAAEKFQIFRKLHEKELSAAVIGRRVGIHRKHCESFLDFLVFLGLMRKKGNLYINSTLANKHFVQGRSANWTSSYFPQIHVISQSRSLNHSKRDGFCFGVADL